ncbi:Glycosyl transferase group 2 [Mactra antiquata]
MGQNRTNLLESKIDIESAKDLKPIIDDSRKIKVKHICVLITLLLFITVVTITNYYTRGVSPTEETNGKEKHYILFIIGLIPYLSIPVTILNCLGLICYNPYRKVTSAIQGMQSAPFLCFRTVTRGDYPDYVRRNAIANRDKCLKLGIKNFIIEIVSDKDINVPDTEDMIREIVVPKSYTTKNNTLYKARALNYCLEGHVNTLASNDWIVHLDEETLVTDSSLHGILHFITETDADIGQGPISYANGDEIKNWLTTLADSIRLSLDYALFRFQFEYLNCPLFGLKGSYIVIRNKVEMDVGLDNGPSGSIAEDCFFALKAWAIGYKFQFITGEMKEKSPFTLLDFIRQRRRWFVGQTYTILCNKIPLVYKLGIMSSLTCCLLMPVSFSNIFIDMIFPYKKPIAFCFLSGFVGGTFAFLYGFGAFLSCEHRKWSYTRRIFVSLVCCALIIPCSVVMESIAAYWGLLTLNSNDFFIIQKDTQSRKRRTGHTKIM